MPRSPAVIYQSDAVALLSGRAIEFCACLVICEVLRVRIQVEACPASDQHVYVPLLRLRVRHDCGAPTRPSLGALTYSTARASGLPQRTGSNCTASSRIPVHSNKLMSHMVKSV
jgi:hypothetical protein